MKYLVFFIVILSLNAQAHDCNPITYIFQPAHAFNDLMMHWSKPESHPFIDSCVSVDLEKGKVLSAKSNDETHELNIYMRNLPNQTQGGKDMDIFFKSAKEKIKARIAKERQKIRNVKSCLQKKSFNECIAIDSETKDLVGRSGDYNFTDLIGDARLNLLLSYPESFLKSIRGSVSILNKYQNNYGVFKKKRWSSFTAEELSAGQEALDYYFKVAAEEVKDLPNPKNYNFGYRVSQMVKEVRSAHLIYYTEMMARYPILQFIKNPNPSKQEVSSAVDQMLKSIDDEEKWLEEVTSSIGSGQLHKDLLKTLNYRQEIQETLSERNEYCGVARDLKHLAEAKGLGFDVGVIAPVMVASFFVPISYAAVLGVASGGVLSFNEHRHVQEASYRVLGRFDPQSTEDLNELSEKAQTRNIELFSTAIGVPSLRFVGKSYRAGESMLSIKPRFSKRSNTKSD